MSKKTLILTQSQLDEICGVKCSYLDDTPQYDSNEIYVSDVNVTDNNPTGDDIAHEQPNVNSRATRVINGRANSLMEINSNIQGKMFGAENGDAGHTAQATAMAKSRLKKAKEKLATSQDVSEKQKALQTINRMKENAPNLEAQINQFDAAVKNDKTIRQNKVKNGMRVISQHTKTSGNGKGHTSNNGIITYEK